MFEDKWVAHGDLPTDLLIHGVDVGLVDGHTLLSQLTGVVDGHIMQLRVLRPVLIWNIKFTLKSTA